MIARVAMVIFGSLLIAIAIAGAVGPVRLLAGLIAVPLMWGSSPLPCLPYGRACGFTGRFRDCRPSGCGCARRAARGTRWRDTTAYSCNVA